MRLLLTKLKSNKHVLALMCIPILAWYISTNWYQLMLIQGRSMTPTYHHMQLVLLNKHNSEYAKGNVIAFYSKELSCVLVKRIVACPGDAAVICEGTLMVNDLMSELYPEEGRFDFSGLLSEEILLEEGMYLVIGDNIEESIDSRYPEVGVVKREDILGVVVGS